MGVAVQAVIERSGTSGWRLAGPVWILALGILIAVGDTMLHRTAVTNWITAAGPGAAAPGSARPPSWAPP
ncbi:hypothetical protein SMICM17S_06971 [Streptomyces microflavus]